MTHTPVTDPTTPAAADDAADDVHTPDPAGTPGKRRAPGPARGPLPGHLAHLAHLGRNLTRRPNRRTLTTTATIVGLLTAITLITGRPDAGILTGHPQLDGPLTTAARWALGHHTPPVTARSLNDPRLAGHYQPADITVDLNHDGRPDTTIDANNNGRLDPGDTTTKTLTTQRDTVLNTVAANPTRTHLSEILLTPAGPGWWTLATAEAPDLTLWSQPAPTNAYWYAETTGNAIHPLTHQLTTYKTLDIAFTTPTALHDWLAHLTHTYKTPQGLTVDPTQNFTTIARANVLTITPPWVAPDHEPLPAITRPLTNIRPRAAAWTVDYGTQHTQQADHATTPGYTKALTTYYADLGYTATTEWNAVATNPDGPWTGTLTGYNPHAFNINGAIAALGHTQKWDCPDGGSGGCNQIDPGLYNVFQYTTYRLPNGTGIGLHTNYLPKNAPKTADLVFGYTPAAIQGIIDKTNAIDPNPIPLLNGWITGTTQVLYTRPGPFPALTNTGQ